MKLLYRRQKSLFMHCSSTVHVFKNIKNGSHDTIHTFKNYFATVFSVFSKINCIQIDPIKKFIDPKSKTKYTSPKKIAQQQKLLIVKLLKKLSSIN